MSEMVFAALLTRKDTEETLDSCSPFTGHSPREVVSLYNKQIQYSVTPNGSICLSVHCRPTIALIAITLGLFLPPPLHCMLFAILS